MTALIVGGSKSGKSSLAQQLAVELAGDGKLYYLATMVPRDGEDLARIARHLEDRAGMGFETVEQGKNLPGCLSRADRSGTFLLDSVTALLTNEFFPPELDYAPDYAAGQRVGDDILSLGGQGQQAVDGLFRQQHILGLAADVDLVVPVQHLDPQLVFDDAQVLVKGAKDADHMLHSFYFNGFFYHLVSFLRRS